MYNFTSGWAILCAELMIAVHIQEPLAVLPDHTCPDGPYLFKGVGNILAVNFRIADLLQKIAVASDPEVFGNFI